VGVFFLNTLQFFQAKRYGSIPTGTPLTSSAGGIKKSRFSTSISLCLGNDIR